MDLASVVQETVDIDALEGVSHDTLFVELTELLKRENLEHVNSISSPVKLKNSFYTRYVKRILDILISLIALIITFPINLILALCTFLDVGRPIFFFQERPGKNGVPFTLVKFRNMTNEKDEFGELLPAAKRVTRFGHFVRKTSLDELLNFWSIFKGDMSFIGPRPLSVYYEPLYSDRHKMREAVRPGLECPFLKMADHKSTWKEQFENDILYVENVSFLLDLKMVFHLVSLAFNKEGSTMRGNAMRGSFLGYDWDGESVNSKEVPSCYYNRIEEINRASSPGEG